MSASEIDILSEFLPKASVQEVIYLLDAEEVDIKIKKERKTRHGDYRLLSNGKHQITVNSNLNQYKFLITLVHEIAHLRAYKNFGLQIKPHGKEWKLTFQRLMLPFINPEIFPVELLSLVAKHFKNPKASSDTDVNLALALKRHNPFSDKVFVQDINIGDSFRLYNGRIFQRGEKRRKRIECLERKTGRVYLFNPLAEVDIIE
ncbi:MAG: SprT-like domain-containing protein [Bacteroidota bacterium]